MKCLESRMKFFNYWDSYTEMEIIWWGSCNLQQLSDPELQDCGFSEVGRR